MKLKSILLVSVCFLMVEACNLECHKKEAEKFTSKMDSLSKQDSVLLNTILDTTSVDTLKK